MIDNSNDRKQRNTKTSQYESWGAKVIDRLSCDLKKAFPEMSGFSPRNLQYMRAFADAWKDRTIVQEALAQIPWRSNIQGKFYGF